MKLPLAQFLIRLKSDELLNVIIDDRPNCKDIRRCVTGTGSLRDPVLDDYYMSADVWCVGVNDDGILEIKAVV